GRADSLASRGVCVLRWMARTVLVRQHEASASWPRRMESALSRLCQSLWLRSEDTPYSPAAHKRQSGAGGRLREEQFSQWPNLRRSGRSERTRTSLARYNSERADPRHDRRTARGFVAAGRTRARWVD